MATFTYQLAYWAWVKLEKEEIKRERSGERYLADCRGAYADAGGIAEMERLEKQLGELTKAKATKP
jgi:hypothetical protein